jgi:hypothetical protein
MLRKSYVLASKGPFMAGRGFFIGGGTLFALF